MNEVGIKIIGGEPFVNGEKAKLVQEDSLIESLSNYICPFCNARLAKNVFICLNACHISVGTRNRLAKRGMHL